MTKYQSGVEYLQSIRNQYRRYLSVERELAERKNAIYQVKGQAYNKDKVSGGTPTDISDKLILVEKYQKMVLKEHDELMAMRIEARSMIDLVRDDDEKAVLREWYLDHKSFRSISRTIRTSRNTIRKIKEAAESNFDIVYRRISEPKE